MWPKTLSPAIITAIIISLLPSSTWFSLIPQHLSHFLTWWKVVWAHDYVLLVEAPSSGGVGNEDPNVPTPGPFCNCSLQYQKMLFMLLKKNMYKWVTDRWMKLSTISSLHKQPPIRFVCWGLQWQRQCPVRYLTLWSLCGWWSHDLCLTDVLPVTWVVLVDFHLGYPQQPTLWSITSEHSHQQTH